MKTHELIKKALKRKQKLNPSYSLRALARDLKLSAAFISRVLNGQQNIPLERLEDLAQVLSLDQMNIRDIKVSIATEFLKRLNLDSKTISRTHKSTYLENYEDSNITAKSLSILGQWYHLPILELVTCAIKVDLKTWAKKLNITHGQVKQSFDYLLEEGYIEEKSGQFRKTDKKLRLPLKKSEAIVRTFHRSMLQKANEHMHQHTDETSYRNRLITSTSIAVNPENLQKAKQRLLEAQLEVADILSEGECTEVYDLSLVLFPLTT